MLLSLLRLTRWPGRSAAVLLLVLTYAWGFVALDITHTHASAPAQAAHALTPTASAAPPGQPAVTRTSAAALDVPCPVCAAVHAATAALVQPPAPIHVLGPARLFGSWPTSFALTASPSSLHLRGPPQA